MANLSNEHILRNIKYCKEAKIFFIFRKVSIDSQSIAYENVVMTSFGLRKKRVIDQWPL